MLIVEGAKETRWVFEVKDCHRFYERLSKRGIKFTELPVDQPWGVTDAHFEDLYGNIFVVESPRARTKRIQTLSVRWWSLTDGGKYSPVGRGMPPQNGSDRQCRWGQHTMRLNPYLTVNRQCAEAEGLNQMAGRFPGVMP
jgi:hypothetical protein